MAADLALVERMRAGEQAAFHEFFTTYAPRIAGFASRRSALADAALEDVVQVTLNKAFRALPGFRARASLFTWLCQICRNHLADLARQEARRPEPPSLDAAIAGAAGADLLATADMRDPLD